MKFTNGYWLTRDEIEPIYAVEYGYHRVDGDVLQGICTEYAYQSERRLCEYPDADDHIFQSYGRCDKGFGRTFSRESEKRTFF